MQLLRWFKFVILLVACAFGAWRAVQELSIHYSEKEPTAFTAARFAEEYNGQHWLRVEGRLAVEYAHVQVSNYEHHEGKDIVYLTVPLVSADWKQTDPVHVVACYGPMPHGAVAAWQSDRARRSSNVATGTIRPLGGGRTDFFFPQLTFTNPVVFINDGNEPDAPALMYVFLGICLLPVPFLVAGLIAGLRHRKREAAQSYAEDALPPL